MLPLFEESLDCQMIYNIKVDPEPVDDWRIPFLEALQNGAFLPNEPKLGEE